MKNMQIDIDSEIMKVSLRKFIKEKAIKFGTKIIYQKGTYIVEENPKTNEIVRVKSIGVN
jgi:hypothetical protein